MKRTPSFIRGIWLLLLLAGSFAGWAHTTTDSAVVSKIAATFNKIKGENRLVGEFAASDQASLPIGILKEINGKDYIIAIDQARFTTQGAFFNIYAQLTLPGTTEELSFAAVNVAFTPGGIAAAAGTRLELVSTHTIPLGDKVDLVLPGDKGNYIEWDCSGFKSVNLKGQFEFKRGFLEPLNEKDQKVTATFQLNAKDLHNLLARVDITPFTISGIRDFGFEVKEAVVDMSDIVNPDGLMLTGNDLAAWGGEPNLWQGFFLKELNIYLPTELADDKGNRPVVRASNMMIDNNGVSGKFSAANLIKIGDASAGGWPLSVDFIEIQLQQNRLKGGSLKGYLNIDFLGDDPLRYTAVVETRQEDTYYAFVLETTEDKKFNCFAGEIQLYANSQVKIERYRGQFIPSAVLHGKLHIAKGLVKAPGIGFQDLTVSTQKPYVHKGVLSLDGSIGFKLGNFKCSFDSLKLGLSAGQFAISAKVRMAMMNEDDKGFAATTGVMVLGSLHEEKQTVNNGKTTVEKVRTKWKFDKVKVTDIAINCKTQAFEIEGLVALFDEHPVYGNGFKGKLSLKLPALEKIVAHAMFGSKDDYKYWHVDAFVPIRIPISPALSIRRLLGGLSYHMERPADFDPYNISSALPDSTGMALTDELLSYVPKKEAGLGFLAGATIATEPTATVFNGDVMFEIMFSTSGGLRYVQFDGAGYFFTDVNQRASGNEAAAAPVTAIVYMRFDNTNKSFHANIKTYIDVAGIIKGTGPNNLAVEAVMHFDPQDWWIYIGRPSQMMGLNILNLATVQSYFQAGTKVEDMPLPPPEVTSVLDMGDGNFMEKENAMSTGRGIGFGLHFKVSLGIGKDKGFLYAYLGVGGGADILLRDYGEARCKGSGTIGINGWYASGQAYAYLQGRVGVRVKVLGKKKEFDILYLAAAALLQAKMPNPAWFRGAVGVKYSILGGLVKGKASIKMEIGSQCELISGKEIDIKIINDIKPDDQSGEVSVFGSPQVAFNLAVEKEFSMMNNEDVVTRYRVKLDEFILKDKKTGIIPGELEWNDGKDAATLNFRDILPPDADLTAAVKIHIEKWTGREWAALTENGSVDYETKSVTFHTGAAPGNIPPENIAYSYPVHQQYNFYPKEHPQAYIKLKRGQPYLFNEKDNNGSWKFYARFETTDGDVLNAPLVYDAANVQLNFDIPRLGEETIYRLGIVKAPAVAVSVNENVAVQRTSVDAEDDSTTIDAKTLKGVALAATETSLHESHFRTSKYATFRDKMNATTNTMDLFDIATDYVPVIGKRFDSYETFDRFELSGDGSKTAPMLFARAVPSNNWLAQKIIPLLYQTYPMDKDITIDNRDVRKMGSPPLLAVGVFNNNQDSYELTAEAVSAGVASGMPGRFRIMYFLSYVSYQDYHELMSKAVAKYLSANSGYGAIPPGIQQLFVTTYPELEANQQYTIELNYRLPGTNTVTTNMNYNILYR